MIHSYPTFSHMNDAFSHGFPMVCTYATTESPWPFFSRKDSQTCRATRLAALHWNSDVIIVIISDHIGEWYIIYYNVLFLYTNVTATLLFISLFRCYLSFTNMIAIWAYGWNCGPLPHGIMMRPKPRASCMVWPHVYEGVPRHPRDNCCHRNTPVANLCWK